MNCHLTLSSLYSLLVLHHRPEQYYHTITITSTHIPYSATRVVVFVCACGVCDIYEMMRDVMRYVVIHFVIIKRR